MKGYAEEMLYFIAIFFAVFMLFVFLTYQRGTKGAEARKVVEERSLSEEIAGVIFSLFNNKLPIVEKSYLEVGIDSILKGVATGEEKYKVFYGIGIGTVNLTEIISPFLDNYVKRRYELRIITPDGEYIYGKLEKKEVLYVYEALIPVPEERVGKVIFTLGKP
jgi:hypothetical protein